MPKAPSAVLVRLTPGEFDTMVGRTRLGEAARAMTRMVLVDGEAPADVAARLGVDRQLVHQALTSIRRVATPTEGVVKLDIELPATISQPLVAFAEALGRCQFPHERAAAMAYFVTAVGEAARMLEPMFTVEDR